MKAQEKSVKFPEIHIPKAGASDARWFIYFSCINPRTGKLDRVKRYEDLNRIHDLQQRQARARELRDHYRRKLKHGWNPFNDQLRYLYKEAEPEPVASTAAQTTITEHLFKVLREQRRRLRPGSFRTYQSQLRVFSAWLKKTDRDRLPLKEFTKEHAREFIHSLELHNTTLNTYIHNLRHFFKLLIERELTDKNSFDGIKIFPTEKKPQEYYRPEQQRLVFGYAAEHHPELSLVIQFIYYCLVRPKEIRDLRVGDVDFANARLRVRGEISKNKKTQFVAIPTLFLQTLRAYGLESCNPDHYIFGRDGHPAANRRGKNHFGDCHRDVLKGVGIEGNYGLYGWKHTGAVMFYQQTKDIKALQMQMRHHSLEETDKYLKGLGISDSEALYRHFPAIAA